MAEYLILAENVSFKNNKLTCINIYDKLSTMIMSSGFNFDLAIICGPDWTKGEHKLLIKASGNNGKEVKVGELTVNIPDEDFVYNAFANDLKLVMDESAEYVTFVVYDNEKEIIKRKYPVSSVLVHKSPQKVPPKKNSAEEKKPAEKIETPKEIKEPEPVKTTSSSNSSSKTASRFGTPRRPKYAEFLNLKTEEELNEALTFIAKLPRDNQMKAKLKTNIEQQLKTLKSKKNG